MKLALLGWDSDTESLLQSLVRRNLVEVTRVCRVGTHISALQSFAPYAHYSDDWEDLGAGGDWDAIVVARERDVEDSAEPIKRFTQLGATILLAHPAVDAITGLELDMIQRDTHARLVIDYPNCRHPALNTLKELVQAGEASPIGRVEQLVFERTLARRDRASVVEQLARDADLARSITGKITRVSATAPTTGDEAWASVSVQMTGTSDILVRWSIEPGEPQRGVRITLIGSQGRATLALPLAGDARLEITNSAAGSKAEVIEFPCDEADDQRCRAVVAALQEAMQRESAAAEATASADSPVVDDVGWLAVCRSLEVAELAEVSLRRGRVMELHHDAVTEEDTFKGMMAAIGCLLLLIVPAVLIAAVALDGVWRGWHVDMEGAASGREEISAPRKYWLLLVVIPLVFFLVMQSLRAVFPSRAASGSRAPDSAKPENLN